MTSCPSGTELKSYIEFLRTYSEHHKNLTAVDALRKGIKEWQCVQSKGKKKQHASHPIVHPSEIDAAVHDPPSRKSKRWYWIFGKRNKK